MRVAGIQELIDPKDWRYVDSKSNSADNVTRGKALAELAKPMESRAIVPPLHHPGADRVYTGY